VHFNIRFTTEAQRTPRKVFLCPPEADIKFYEKIGHPALAGETAGGQKVQALRAKIHFDS